MKKLLPNGSVVTLKDGKKSLIIIGAMQKDEENNVYDYIACVYPEGYINSELFFLFNHEDIENVRFVGYIDAESQAYMQMLSESEF